MKRKQTFIDRDTGIAATITTTEIIEAGVDGNASHWRSTVRVTAVPGRAAGPFVRAR